MNLIRQIGSERTDRITALISALGNRLEIRQHPEEREEYRHLDEDRKTGGEGIRPVFSVQRHHLLLLALLRSGILLPLVLRLKRLELGLHELHSPAGPNLPDEQRHDEDPYEDRQSNDRQHPGNAWTITQADENQEFVDVDHDPGDGDLEGPQDRVHCTPCYKAIRRGEYRSHGSQPSGIFGLLPMMIIRQSGRARNGECRGDGDSAIDQDREHDQRHQESRDCIARVARKPGERP